MTCIFFTWNGFPFSKCADCDSKNTDQ